MKNSKNKIVSITFTGLLILCISLCEVSAQSQIVYTIIKNGKIFSMVELPEAKVTASAINNQCFIKNENQGAFTKTANLIKSEKHSIEDIPSVSNNDESIASEKVQTQSNSGFNRALQFVIDFITDYISHYGIIH